MNVLMKVSEACPLACGYCYEGDLQGQTPSGEPLDLPGLRMSEETLENAITKIQAREGAKFTEYIWHGKEPTTMGVPFYRKAREIQKRQTESKKAVRNSMQTNGVLLTPTMADFFVEEDFSLGFSLDGPRRLHDEMRPYLNGKGSFDQVMRGIRLMQERGKSPGVIAVLTKKSLPYLDEMYDFFKSEGLAFKINPVMKAGRARGKMAELGLTPAERTEAVCHLFDRWFYDSVPSAEGSSGKKGRAVDYGNMFGLARGLMTNGGTSCDTLPNCQYSFAAVSAGGEVLPCSRYSPTGISYGNVNSERTFDEILASPKRQKILTRLDSLPECLQCDYSFLCNAGCMHNAHLEGDIMKKDPNCASNRAIYEHVAGRILEQLEKDGAIKVKGS